MAEHKFNGEADLRNQNTNPRLEDMMKTNTTRRWIGCLAAVAWMLGAAGCEDAETSSALSVTPASSELIGRGATVVLTASMPGDIAPTNTSEEVILPLEWSVSNPSLGGIMRSAGHTAVYESNGTVGQNVVIAKDLFGREGLAAINQRRPEELPAP
jgi:hypothetical protein